VRSAFVRKTTRICDDLFNCLHGLIERNTLGSATPRYSASLTDTAPGWKSMVEGGREGGREAGME